MILHLLCPPPSIFLPLCTLSIFVCTKRKHSLSITHRDMSRSLMGWIEKSVDDLPSFPRLDAQECMKRSICEAHRDPKKYGLAGLVLQLFFP